MPWAVEQLSTALDPVGDGFAALQSGAMTPSLVSSAKKEAHNLEQFLAAYWRIITDGPPAPGKTFKHLHFDPDSGAKRFYELRVGGWASVFWVDYEQQICVAVFSYRTPSGYLSPLPLAEALVYPRSLPIAAAFRALDHLVVQWLKSEKNIIVV